MMLYNMISAVANFFGRAARNQPLTPAQRAFLRSLDGVAITVFLPAVQIVWSAFWQWFNNQAVAVDWMSTLHTATSAALAAAVFVAVKYVRARGGSVVAPLVAGDTLPIAPGHTAVNGPDGLVHIVEASATALTSGANGTNYPKDLADNGILSASQSGTPTGTPVSAPISTPAPDAVANQ